MRSRRFRFRRSETPEVSLTPLIDTALTLLIIFMVTTPILHHGIKVELPKGSIKEAGKDPQEMIVSIDEKGTVYFNNEQVALGALGTIIKNHITINQALQDKSVFVRVNGATTTCDTLVAVIDSIKVVAGIKDVRIATQKTVCQNT
jgi:biopolymer transport protein ExbD